MSFYYNFDKVFSYNALINLVVGGRGIGKSFNSKLAVIKRFLKTGEQFVYVRRYKTELDSAVPTFFQSIQAKGYFEDHVFKVRKSKMLTEFYCDGEICGYAIALSTSNVLKSAEFPNVKTIIFDEYPIEDTRHKHYLKNEGRGCNMLVKSSHVVAIRDELSGTVKENFLDILLKNLAYLRKIAIIP